MATHTVRIIMNGVTGRMGYRQHLLRSILPIREQGGVTLADGSTLQVEPVLVGRNAEKVEALAKQHGVERWSTDLDAVIDMLTRDGHSDQLQLRRLKKRKLQLKDCITKLESLQIPDEPA